MGRVLAVSAKEKCPLAFPGDKEEREVQLISLKKNQFWIAVKDLGWLFERLRSENELAGVPLILNPDEDRAAVAAPSNGSDSQETLSSTAEGPAGSGEARSAGSGGPASAQGTVDNGYVCKWNFPTRADKGSWQATVTREGEYKGKTVTCEMAKFTKAKWNKVYSDGKEEPCKYARASVAQKKEACRLYLDQHMATVLSS